MAAVAPETAQLSGWTSRLADAVVVAAAALTGLPELQAARLRATDDGVALELPDACLRLGGLGAQDRGQRPLSLRFEGAGARGLRARARVDRAALPALAAAHDAWRPFAALPDEEFRKLSSSPAGPYATLRLGYRCNQDCWFCWQDRTAPSPPPEQYERWLDELAVMGVRALNLTGGEATTWPELPALIERAARAHGMAVSLQTNGIRLGRGAYAAKLRDAGLQAAMVSYHSADPTVSDRMTRAPGTHAATVRGVEAALAVGLHTTLTCVVEAENVDGLPAHADDIVARFVAPFPDNPVQRVTYAHPTAYFSPGGWQAQQVSFDRVRAPLTAAVLALRAADVPVQLGGPCGFPLCALEVDRIDDPYRVLGRDTYSPQELVHRRFAPACAGCRERPRCFGLRQEYVDRFGDQGLRPIR